ncbi:glycosyltransferase [Lacibacterium aquatile]|uniref:Glycosyltransferase n=1 Tax=Lacibacterium aquatile TaxID=1168082 RepID=A0ABW5E0T2_9PROT
MRLLFCTSYPHLPEVIGGLQTATDDLCEMLVERGVECIFLCGQSPHGPRQVQRQDDKFGYKVIRAADPVSALPMIAASFEPTAIIVQTGYVLMPMLIAAVETRIPTAIYLHNLELQQIGGNLMPHPSLFFISNSDYTAKRLRALANIQSLVLPPVVRPERYIAPHIGNRVLFVNPTQVKGVDIVVRLAEAHPDIPFTLVESWELDGAWRNYQRRRTDCLHNVEWLPPTDDMKSLYAQARLLMMPSLWEEAYGRTVIEAQLNGLPVISSDRGALPDTVGEGGMVLHAHAPIEDWSHALSLVYKDPATWGYLSAKALENARNTVLSNQIQIDELLSRLAIHPPPEL